MSSRGLSSLLATPSALRPVLLQAVLASNPTSFGSSSIPTAPSPSQSRSLTRNATKTAPKTTSRIIPKAASKTSDTSRSKASSKKVSSAASKTASKTVAKTGSRSAIKTNPKKASKAVQTKASKRVTESDQNATPKTAPRRTNTSSHNATRPRAWRARPIADPPAADTKPPSALSFIPTSSPDDLSNDTLSKPTGISIVRNIKPADLSRARMLFGGGQFLHSSPRFLNLPFNSYIPEVCLIGRSNVGKSTLINALAGMSGKEAGTAHGPQASKAGAAITSSRAGCTKLMNAYGFGPPLSVKPLTTKMQRARNQKQAGRSRSERRQSEGLIKEPPPQHSIILMDVPGYGFNSQTLWGEEIMKYLEKREILRGAVLLIDAVAGIKSADRAMMKALRDISVYTTVVLTKADGLVRSPDHAAWASSERLQEATLHVLEEMRRIEKNGDPGTAWSEGIDWNPEIFVTGAGDPRMGGMGVDGARLAISQMAGHIKKTDVTTDADADADDSEIVPYDQLVFGPSSTTTGLPQPEMMPQDQLLFGLDSTTDDNHTEVVASEAQVVETDQQVYKPKRTQGRTRLGRKRRADNIDPMDPMASLMGAARRPSRKQLGEASF